MSGLLIPAIVLILCVACNNNSERSIKTGTDSAVTIRINPGEARSDMINLSYIADRIEYIPLQTSDSIVMGTYLDFYITDDLIFVRDQNCILEFDKNGRFIRKMFTVGNGPEESIARSFAVNESERFIYAFDIHSRKGNIYDFDGRFVSTFNTKLCDPNYWINNIAYFRSNIFLSFPVRPGTDYLYSCFDLRNDSIKILHQNPNVFTVSQENLVPMIVPSSNSYQVTDSHILFKDMFCDTVFITNKEFRTKPCYIIELGSEKLQWEDFRDHGMFDISSGPPNGYYVESFVDTKSYLLLFVQSFKWPELLCIYDKKTGELAISSNRDYKTADQQVLMKNDLDHMTSFPPMSKGDGKFYYHDECLYSIIEAKEFVDIYRAVSPEVLNSTDYLRRMKPLFVQMDEFSNPVIMKIHLK